MRIVPKGKCKECEEDSHPLIKIEGGYSSSSGRATILMCRGCLEEALGLVKLAERASSSDEGE